MGNIPKTLPGAALWIVFALPSLRPASLCAEASAPSPPPLVADYDAGEMYWALEGRKRPVPGLRESWVFNRAMTWLDAADGADGTVLCYSNRSPLLLTGQEAVSRWYAVAKDEVVAADRETTRFVKKDDQTDWDAAALPPFQFHIEQNPAAELEVLEATRPWQFIAAVKGRSGPPLYAGPWREGPGKVEADLRALYRDKGYAGNFAQLQFFVALRAPTPKDEGQIRFRLRLLGREAVITSLPVIRTAESTRSSGAPICAVVVDASGRRLGPDAVAVTAEVGAQTIALADAGGGLWKGVVRDLPAGDHAARVRAVWKDGGRKAESTLSIRVTDGRFIAYDPRLRLLTKSGKPLGPLTGSYRGAPMFKHIGTPEESLVIGQAEWDAVKGRLHYGQHFNHGGEHYGFHYWEALTERELEQDYARLAACGWTLVHLCQGAWIWERLDAGGRIAPHGAERLAAVIAAAQRHGLYVHFALTHYPLGKWAKPYDRYVEAGYQPNQYGDTGSAFYTLIGGYLKDFVTLFREDSALSSFTASGEGDVACGKTFVNWCHDFIQAHDRNHLFACEPHINPKPFPSDPNFYLREGWKPLLAGMRTYMVDKLKFEYVPVQLKIGALGHVFLGEGLFWGYLNAPNQTDRYRRRVRWEFYTALAYRSPIQLSWEERVVEDERIVFERVRRAVDWSKPFRRPGLTLRIGKDLHGLTRYEEALSQIPLEYAIALKDDPAPAGTLATIDTEAEFTEPTFALAGGALPETLKAEAPLRIPKGFAAHYSWTEDRDVLLAFIRPVVFQPAGGEASEGPADAGPAGARIELNNFPDRKLRYRLYDLAAKKMAAEGEFAKGVTIAIPAGASDLFVVTGMGMK